MKAEARLAPSQYRSAASVEADAQASLSFGTNFKRNSLVYKNDIYCKIDLSSIQIPEMLKMYGETKSAWIIWGIIVIASITTMLYFAQPMSETRQAWVPESYNYVNKASADTKPLEIESIDFGASTVNVPFDNNYQQAFGVNDKSKIILVRDKGVMLGWLGVHYLAEKDGVVYSAAATYGWSYLLALDNVVLADDGQLQMSYKTAWLSIIFLSIISMFIGAIVVSNYNEKIYKAWRSWKRKAMPRVSPS